MNRKKKDALMEVTAVQHAQTPSSSEGGSLSHLRH